jgi:ABC-2 type transport system permease protein
MRVFWCLLKREVGAYFLSPIAYVMLFSFMLLTGLSFWRLADMLAYGDSLNTARQWFFGSPVLWFSMPVIIPLLTMRSFAEEKRMGTIESLMTAPVTELSVVMAKFWGALFFFALMWLPSLGYIFVLQHLLPHVAFLDLGVVSSGALGMLLVGAFYISVGLLTSSMTSNQVVAAIFSFVVLCVMFFAGLFTAFSTSSEALREVGSVMCSYLHVLDFARGVVDSRPVILYLTLTGLVLFTTVRMVQQGKWK